MAAFTRAQKITALLAITMVVITTLAFVATRGTDSAVDVESATASPTPATTAVLDRDRGIWNDVRDTIRGAADTESPVPCPFIDERQIEDNNFLSITPGLTFVCDATGIDATPVAPGRVVMRVTQPPLNSFKAQLLANGRDGPWLRAAAYGNFVAIDHGPLNDTGNVTTIYAGLGTINPELRLGQLVDTDTSLGSLAGLNINGTVVNGVLTFEFLSDDTRFGGDPLRDAPPSVSESNRLAAPLAPAIGNPAPTCTSPWGDDDLLVGANRDYRSGVHNGLDFNCRTNDHTIIASGEGQVVFIVDDYQDATVEDRNAVLANAAQAIDTPFWTLAMLYGNMVIVDHEVPGLDAHVVTIYAHLDEVNPDLAPGSPVQAGTPLGLAGNRGTSTAAAGITDNHPSVHLHWELHVDDRPVGYLQYPEDTEPLYLDILCEQTRAAPTPAPASISATPVPAIESEPGC